MSKLVLMMGIPGAGKSTWLRKNMKPDGVIASRDAIRFNLLEEGDEYFSRETEVFREYISQIVEALKADKTVYADATHLNQKSRAKVVNAVKKFIIPDEIECIWLDTSYAVAIERNDLREGRALVPHDAIKRMFHQLEPPAAEEGFSNIIIIEGDEDE